MTGPAATGRPPLPSDDFMTREQWDVFFALVDGVVPAFAPRSKAGRDGAGSAVLLPDHEYEALLDDAAATLPAGQSRDQLAEFLASRMSTDRALREELVRSLARSPGRHQLAGLMDFLK